MTEPRPPSGERAVGALHGVRVVELAREPIAWAGKLLADMGADVVLVEPPGGDPCRGYPPFLDDEPGEDRSLYWWHYHTSKRGVVIDLDEPDGRERFRALVGTADVLLEAEPRRRLGALGLDYEDLTAIRPDVVHVSVTPYGRNDPKSDAPFTDLTIMAASGPPWSCGYDDHSLAPVRGPMQGYHTASHFAVLSVLTALVHCRVAGQGQFIDVSMTAANNVTTEAATYTWLVAQKTVQRQTGRHASVSPSRETQQECADGRYANTGVPPRRPHEFAALDKWLKELGLDAELPEAVFLTMGANWEGPFDLARIGRDDEITAIFGAGRDALRLIASRVPAQEFFLGCQRAGLAVGVVNAPEDAFEDEHFKARGFQVPVVHDDLKRTVVYPGAPYAFGGSPWAISRRAPRLGEHDAEIFAEIGVR
ncbi:MAG: CoA transferase [Gammaproteobacteria bacterium]|nr:CoA transferase [Gammaproteobacteria bacterium]